MLNIDHHITRARETRQVHQLCAAPIEWCSTARVGRRGKAWATDCCLIKKGACHYPMGRAKALIPHHINLPRILATNKVMRLRHVACYRAQSDAHPGRSQLRC